MLQRLACLVQRLVALAAARNRVADSDFKLLLTEQSAEFERT